MNIDVFLLTVPRTLTKNPVPLHLQKQSKYDFVQIVEVPLAEMACVSRNIRTTRIESFALFQSNVPFLDARSPILNKKSITKNQADFIIAVMGDSNQCELLTLG